MARKLKDTAAVAPIVKSIKGTDANLQCRGYQFEVGKTFTHGGAVVACVSGFHACPVDQHPLSVFEYYPPAGARYFEVTQGGATVARDNKLASATVTIDFELTIGDLVKRAWDYVWSRATRSDESHVAVDYGAASATGTQGAAMSVGYEGKVMGADGNALFCVERHAWNGPIVSVASGIVGQDGIVAGRWYTARGGKLVEVL